MAGQRGIAGEDRICSDRGRNEGDACQLPTRRTWHEPDNQTNNLVAMHHDSYTLGTSRDANGADHGGSGGPCYYSDGAGGVIVGGIVTAKAGDASAL